jgi:hypothetical protein
MPQYTLIVKTYQKVIKGNPRWCGIIGIKDGETLRKETDKSTFTEVSKALRSHGLIPATVEILKRDNVVFQHNSNEILKPQKPTRNISADNFVAVIMEKAHSGNVSDKTLGQFIRENEKFVLYQGCDDEKK